MEEPWVDWDWVADHRELIWDLFRSHVELTVVAVVIGLALSFPLALAARRWRLLYGPVLSATGVLYAIPSLALFALLLPWTGLTRTTALIGLVSYTLLILVRNIVAGLDGVAPEVREAATAMGMRGPLRLVSVELPLALPAVVAGIRVATVTTIGLVTVAALIGHGGLGQLILDGLNRSFPTPLIVGSALSVALAAVADVALVGAQRLLSPWATRDR
ncbi:ABC transporter permease [soil metagenome]|nr:ABC transporter permease [Acidimicrobiia bacterium]MBA3955486.1 ABC transporter permease [Acidimicrobiia bacterium]